MTLIIQKPTGGKLVVERPASAAWVTTGKSDAALAGFSSLTFSGPFLLPRDGWDIGTAGTTLYGVGIKNVGVDEPIHNASGSIM
jgi:hypothetical protein